LDAQTIQVWRLLFSRKLFLKKTHFSKKILQGNSQSATTPPLKTEEFRRKAAAWLTGSFAMWQQGWIMG